jgi:NAD(P)-dependent dehydrogenase (short-subunit alcohol dehydrogenase family)
MSERMRDKVTLISGAGGPRGQGASHAELIGKEGGKVVLADVTDDTGQALAEKLAGDGLDVAYTHLDVTKPDEWDAAIRFTEDRYGKVNVLVNNAGLESRPSLIECTDEEWQRVIGVNQTGVFLGMRHGVPALKRAGGGSVINISSVYGLNGAAGFVSYIASKAAVIGMTKSAAMSHGEDNIRVNAIAPGLINTPMLTENDTREMSTLDPFLAKQAIRLIAEPIEISYAVLYLASDESRFVTGTVLPVDGGYSAT